MLKYILGTVFVLALMFTIAVAGVSNQESLSTEAMSASVENEGVASPDDANQIQIIDADKDQLQIMMINCGTSMEYTSDCEPIPFEECTPEQKAACKSNCKPVSYEDCTLEQKAALQKMNIGI